MTSSVRSPSESDSVARANRRFHDLIAVSYDLDPRVRLGVFHPNVRRRYRRELLRHLPEKSERRRILNLGIGTGNLWSEDLDLFVQAFGLDISEEMLLRARSMSGGTAIRGLLQGDARHLPFSPGAFDAVCCFAVLHHLFDPQEVFTEIRRVLRPGGLFYSDYDPNAGFFSALLAHPLTRSPLALYRRWADDTLGIEQTGDLRSCQRLAEYHAEIRPGLIPTKLHEQLLQAGFRFPRVIPHSDGPDLTRPRLGRWLPRLAELFLAGLGVKRYADRAKTLAIIAVA